MNLTFWGSYAARNVAQSTIVKNTILKTLYYIFSIFYLFVELNPLKTILKSYITVKRESNGVTLTTLDFEPW